MALRFLSILPDSETCENFRKPEPDTLKFRNSIAFLKIMTLTLETTAVEITGTLERLEELENVIKHGVTSVWESVKEIRDNRLYKLKGFDKWDDYCKETFELGYSAVNRLCADSEVAKTLPVIEGVRAKASHVAVLKKIEDDEVRAQAWQKAVESAPKGKVTADHVRSAVASVAPDVIAQSKVSQRPEKPVGNPGKERLEEIVQQSAETQLTELRDLVKEMFTHPYFDKRMTNYFIDRARELGVNYDI
jgi:hypothetical protein